ncbi:MAG: cytochrome c3 family protein [Pseudomonadota bacterium]|nr:cytochrome c3 family protein [Pseudomonadota bacterium]
MKNDTFLKGFVGAVLLAMAVPGWSAAVTEDDSTQPRGAPPGVNDDGQVLDPIIEGFRAPAQFEGFILPGEDHNFYEEWVGSMMGNTIRDPAFFATLNVANQDFIDYVNSLSADDRAQLLEDLKLPPDADEELLPVTADLCLRCHAPAGWLEGHSEPPTPSFPFLKGQFWGAAFLEESVTDPVDLLAESEAEMEGVQCDTCHRTYDGQRRSSRHDGSTMMAGNGGMFVSLENPFEEEHGFIPDTVFDFQKEGDFCGTCHDVTNPLITTKTEIDGVVPENMPHPIERTYTEWFWSGYRNNKRCQDCHAPMKFLGAQTWLLSPGLNNLWGNVDQKWVDRGYTVSASRDLALKDGAERNRKFMAEAAAKLEFVDSPKRARAGREVTVNVKVTNLTGHKLPTGFAEGRQMWIHIKAVDKDGNVFFEDGALDGDGALIRNAQTKVYEQEILAEGYPFIDDDAKDLDGDGVISPEEIEKAQHFHFVLMNKIIKDNRIPPMGYNKAAYQADGAFIVPADTYADGQYWDTTPYTFTIPVSARRLVEVTATLYYQTFNREYMEFLKEHDTEPTVSDGGRARDLPGPFRNANNVDRWGETIYALWEDAGNGPPVNMGSAKLDIRVRRRR